jgi:hypothetical protein
VRPVGSRRPPIAGRVFQHQQPNSHGVCVVDLNLNDDADLGGQVQVTIGQGDGLPELVVLLPVLMKLITVVMQGG